MPIRMEVQPLAESEFAFLLSRWLRLRGAREAIKPGAVCFL
jgi:hypothetical protein